MAERGGADERTRVVSWRDPRASLAAGAGLSGLEYLRRVLAGEIPPPPISASLGFSAVEFEEGRAVFAAIPGEHHYNPIGVVHGGLAATLLDSCMGCAVHTLLAAGEGYTSLEIKVNFVRPMTIDTGRVLAEGRVLHRGRTMATAEGSIRAESDGRLLAHGTTTCMVFPAR